MEPKYVRPVHLLGFWLTQLPQTEASIQKSTNSSLYNFVRSYERKFDNQQMCYFDGSQKYNILNTLGGQQITHQAIM